MTVTLFISKSSIKLYDLHVFIVLRCYILLHCFVLKQRWSKFAPSVQFWTGQVILVPSVGWSRELDLPHMNWTLQRVTSVYQGDVCLPEQWPIHWQIDWRLSTWITIIATSRIGDKTVPIHQISDALIEGIQNDVKFSHRIFGQIDIVYFISRCYIFFKLQCEGNCPWKFHFEGVVK